MVTLKYDQFAVHLARDKAAGSDPAPAGLHVWLDVPGLDAAGGELTWNHFVVDDQARLTLAGSTAVPFDTAWNHWSVYSKDDISAQVGASFVPVPGAFGRPAAWPLPARFVRDPKTGKSVLALPNRLPLRLRAFDVTPAGSTAIDGDLAAAAQFYDQLLVELVVERPPLPDKAVHGLPWILWELNPTQRVLAQDFGPGRQQLELSPQPDLSKPPWVGAKDTVVCLWVRDLLNAGTASGIAWPLLDVITTERLDVGQRWTLPTGCPMTIMRESVPPDRPRTGKRGFEHELAHCLLRDAGLGRVVVESVPEGKANMLRFLDRLGVEGPPGRGKPRGQRLYEALFPGVPKRAHAPPGNNLISPIGGDQLVPWQVAVIRAAPETRP